MAAVEVEADGVLSEMIGIGNVCVDAEIEHKGFGRLLMSAAGIYIRENKRKGILLCKSKVKGFYHNCGWQIVCSNNTWINFERYHDGVMMDTEEPQRYKSLVINRNF